MTTEKRCAICLGSFADTYETDLGRVCPTEVHVFEEQAHKFETNLEDVIAGMIARAWAASHEGSEITSIELDWTRRFVKFEASDGAFGEIGNLSDMAGTWLEQTIENLAAMQLALDIVFAEQAGEARA